MLERLVLDAHRGRAEHVEDSAVAVVGEPHVARLPGDALDRGVGQAEVQDRVHHTGHRQGGTRADRDQERVLGVAELGPVERLHLLDCGVDLRLDAVGELLAVVVVGGADFGGDREARRDGDSDDAHLGEVRALAAQERFHLGLAVGLAPAEGVDVFRLRHSRSSSVMGARRPP